MLKFYLKITILAITLANLPTITIHASDSKSSQEELLSQLNQKHNELDKLESRLASINLTLAELDAIRNPSVDAIASECSQIQAEIKSARDLINKEFHTIGTELSRDRRSKKPTEEYKPNLNWE